LILSTESVAAVEPTPARSAAAALVADNALAPCMAFVEALALCGDHTLRLALSRRTALNVQVS
jgi:hypothetical protein